MKVFKSTISQSKYSDIIHLGPLNDINSLYIDIETTGFSRKNDMIYLVGFLYSQNNELVLEQYLTEKISDEYELLYKLNQFVKDFDTIIHFNGDSFDLPFIIERMKLYRIKENINQLTSVDYLKLLRPFKKVLGTDNLKLKTMEQLAGYKRVDPFSGGELIQVFKEYLNGDKGLEETFTLHNEEDMIGLYYLNVFNPLISLTSQTLYEDLNYEIKEDSLNLYIDINSNNHFTTQLDRDHYKLSLSQDQIEVELELFTGEYKTFFDDYNHYYYLTSEDYAIHESMASFVQSKFKKKATKNTAFTKASDTFFICPFSKQELNKLNMFDNSVYIFSQTINDSSSLIRLSDLDKTIKPLLPNLIKKIIT